MKRILSAPLIVLAMAAAHASEPTEKDAIAMVEKGAAYIKQHGKEKFIEKVAAKDPEFIQGALYVDIRDQQTGIVLAHPVNPTIVGKDLTDVPDASGKKYRREIIELAARKLTVPPVTFWTRTDWPTVLVMSPEKLIVPVPPLTSKSTPSTSRISVALSKVKEALLLAIETPAVAARPSPSMVALLT